MRARGISSQQLTARKCNTRFVLDLEDLGFLLAEEKCNWFPQLNLTWLGLNWIMEEGKVYITPKRINKIVESIDRALGKLQKNKLTPVRELAGISGQVISTQIAVGKIVQMRTRELFICINSRAI